MITNTPAVAYLNCQTVSQQLVADRPRSYQVRVRRLLHHRRLRDAQRTTAIAADCDRTRLDGRTGHPGSIDPDDGRPRQTYVYLDPPAGKPSACGADRSRGTASRRGSRFPIRTTVNSMRVHPAASSSTASWSSPTGRTPPVTASHPPRRRSRHARAICRRLQRRKHTFGWHSRTMPSHASAQSPSTEAGQRSVHPQRAAHQVRVRRLLPHGRPGDA